MVRKWIISLLCPILFSLLLCACTSMTEENIKSDIPTQAADGETSDVMESAATDSDESEIDQTDRTGADNDESETKQIVEAATLLYMGQASIRIITAEGKVIYIDPYARDDYDLPADLILVTHGHFDHCAVDKVANRDADCVTITHEDAVKNGEHQIFELGYVTVEAVEAGFNDWHDVNECVGYILTLSNGKSVYVTGDTSATEQMRSLAEKEIDYAFFCCDGVYNMGLEEAANCAEMVGAKHNIPYHNTTNNTGEMFDRELAGQFEVPNRMILYPGEELLVE